MKRRRGDIKATEVAGVSETASSLARRIKKAHEGDDQGISQRGRVTAVITTPEEYHRLAKLAEQHPQELAGLIDAAEQRTGTKRRKKSPGQGGA